MPIFYSSLPDFLSSWMLSQPLFYTASAPLAGDHINVSPKGYVSKSFAIIDENTVAYLDATGSGCETVSHIYENARLTLMFCSFGRSPRICRLFCKGLAIERWDKEGADSVSEGKARERDKFTYWLSKMKEGRQKYRAKDTKTLGDGDVDDQEELGLDSVRAIVVGKIFQAQISCGFGVPLVGGIPQPSDEENALSSDALRSYDSRIPQTPGFHIRTTLMDWGLKQIKRNALTEYQQKNNCRSLDGVPGLKFARRGRGQWLAVDQVQAWLRRTRKQWDAVLAGAALAFLFVLALIKTGVITIESDALHSSLLPLGSLKAHAA